MNSAQVSASNITYIYLPQITSTHIVVWNCIKKGHVYNISFEERLAFNVYGLN